MDGAIVDAYSTGRFLPESLARYGCRCVHVRSGPSTPEFYRRSFDPGEFVADVGYDGSVAETLADLSTRDLAFVIPGHESGVGLADQLAARLNLPANAVELSSARRDKYAMEQALRKAGLAAPEGMVTSSLAELVHWVLLRGSWPVVVKPVSSAGSDNVLFCHSVPDLRHAFHRILSDVDISGRPNQEVLAQQVLRGTEYFVNTVSLAGRHHVAEIWQYSKRPVPGKGLIYDFEEPLPYEGAQQRRLRAYIGQVLDALGVRYGPAHSEVMMTAEGPVLIETGARLAGSILPEAVSRVFGTDHVALTAQAYVRPDEFSQRIGRAYELASGLRYVSLISTRTGTLRSLGGFARIRALPSFAAMHLDVVPGDRLRRTVDSRTSPGYVYLVHDDPRQLRLDYLAIRIAEQGGLYDVG
jgi:biotin carboxylase